MPQETVWQAVVLCGRKERRMFEVNIHPVERIVRGLVGLGVLSLVFWGPKSAWGYLGLIPLVTAVIGWCPPYALLGISTCPKKAGA